jgi:hypothetical protein
LWWGIGFSIANGHLLMQRPLCRLRLAEKIRTLRSSLRGDHAEFQEVHGASAAQARLEEGAVLTFRSQLRENIFFCLFGFMSFGPKFQPCQPYSETIAEQVNVGSLPAASD